MLEYRIDTIPVGYLSYKLADKSIQIEAVLILPAFRQKGLMTQLLNTFLVYLESEDIPY